MHMWMWFGYDLGDFLFSGLTINARWSFAITWIVLFFVAVLFEGSKVYLAKVQREAIKNLLPYRSDERRTLLCDREQPSAMEATTSRNTSTGPVSRWSLFRMRALVNAHQSLVFLAHNTVGYLLMLAVMLYNVHLLLAVVLGMMLGYFLFGTKLTQLQMQCYSTKRVVICTPECDDTAETTPPLLDSPQSSESDFYVCRTRTCIQPSHYFPATADTSSATCHYGAKNCPSMVAKTKQTQAGPCHHAKEDPSAEAHLLKTEDRGCCKKQLETPQESDCCNAGHLEVDSTESTSAQDRSDSGSVSLRPQLAREESPQITCCHAKTTPTDSQEQIIKDL